jgi:outer membrane protein assembly factor BamB
MSIQSKIEPGVKSGEGVQQSEQPRRRSRLSRWLRYGMPIAILGIGGGIEAYFWMQNSDDSTRQVMLSYYTIPPMLLGLLVWWTFFSGIRWTVRSAVLGVLVIGFAGFVYKYRLKEFRGDMVPVFEGRWLQSAEKKAADYWQNQGSQVSASTKGEKTSSAVEPLVISPGDSPQFDGAQRDGRVPGVRIRTDWDHQPPRLLWRHPVGAAWSSFAVVGDYAFTQEQRGQDEAVVCYNARDGKQIWVYLDDNQRFTQPMAGVGPRATPTVFDSRVYTFGAAGVLNCFAARTGALLWSKNSVEEAGVPPVQFGMSCSPLIYDNLVVVNPGGPRSAADGTQTSGRAVVAYDRLTGKEVWAAGDYKAAYASPILATIGGVKQVIIFDAVGGAGHDAATGKQLWRSPVWTNEFQNNCAQPIVLTDGGVLLTSGYGTGSLLLDVKKSGESWAVTERWKAPNKFKLKFNSGVLRDGFIYGLDEGILACLDLSSGKEPWKRGHYGYGQILMFENALFVISEEGDALLVEVTPSKAQELARFHAIDGKTWNHPAYSNGRLYLRNAEEAACYDLGPLQTASR